MLNTNTVSIDELRSNLADIVNRVTYAKDRVVVKKYNRDVALIISLDEYEELMDPTKRLSDAEWKKKVRRLDRIRAKIPNSDPSEMEEAIDEAVREVRAEKKKALENMQSTRNLLRLAGIIPKGSGLPADLSAKHNEYTWD